MTNVRFFFLDHHLGQGHFSTPCFIPCSIPCSTRALLRLHMSLTSLSNSSVMAISKSSCNRFSFSSGVADVENRTFILLCPIDLIGFHLHSGRIPGIIIQFIQHLLQINSICHLYIAVFFDDKFGESIF